MIQMLTTYIESLRRDERGQGLTEYALIIALVSVAALLALGAISGGINAVLNSIGTTLSGA